VPPAVAEAREVATPVPIEPEVEREEPKLEAKPEARPEPDPDAVTLRPPPPAPATSPAPAAASAHPFSAPAAAPTSDRAAAEAADPERMKARKLARLLVSEIKLYNEKVVAEGKAAGNLYDRLKDAIDQTFALFARRVPEAVRADFDYVHDELVRQLAGGDATKLGATYRGGQSAPAPPRASRPGGAGKSR
jgi:hypothetical protein